MTSALETATRGKCKHAALGIYVMSRQYLIHMLSDCVTHNCIHFEREFLTRALMDGTVAGYLFNEYAVKIEDTFDYYRSNMDMLDKGCPQRGIQAHPSDPDPHQGRGSDLLWR